MVTTKQQTKRKERSARNRSHPALRAPVTVNQAEGYNVHLAPAAVTAGQRYWHVTSVRHLSPEENRGRHNVFVDALDENGQRCRVPTLRIGWSWEGRRPDEQAPPKPLDKPDNEPAGNVDLYAGQHLEAWIEGDGLSSDHVVNLHTDHPDEPGPSGQLWNSRGHHSFHVIFQRTRKTPVDGEDGEGTKPTPPTFRFETWPTAFRTITQGFGNNPAYYAQFNLAGHEGIDLKATQGSQIFCVAPGTVKLIYPSPTGHNYGIHVRVEHADGYETIYAHLQTVFVQEGQVVTAGAVLGLADHTGNVIGDPADHLHLTLKHRGETLAGYPNNIIDPTPFLQPLLQAPTDDAHYVRDDIVDSTQVPADQAFTQRWTVRNSGQTTWGAGYVLAFLRGDRLGAPATLPVPSTAPDAEATVAVTFRAPASPGPYRSEWQLRNPAGEWFGQRLWVDINVVAQPVVTVDPDGAVAENKLGFYLHLAINENGLWDAITRVQPPVLLIHADSYNDMLLNEVRAFRAPNAFVIGRWYLENDAQRALLESNDPEGAGRNLAELIMTHDFSKFRKRAANGRLLVDAWMSLNEPIPGPASTSFRENEAALRHLYEHYDRFQVAFRERLVQEGIEAVAFNFAAGNFTEPAHYLDFFPRTLATYTYLGFHEYGWPALFAGPGVATSAGSYRQVLEALQARYGPRHRVIITEAGLTRAYGHPQNPDEGWLNGAEPLDENRYWESLAWYNRQLSQDDYALGACLYQVGHQGRWATFRHLGQDNHGRLLHLVDRLQALHEAAKTRTAQPGARAAALPPAPPLRVTLSGKVSAGDQPVTGAVVRLVGDLNTLGHLRGSVLDQPGVVTWSRRVTNFAGTLRTAWDHFVAGQVAGLTWDEFQRQALIANPSLAIGTGRFVATERYFMPEEAGPTPAVLWDRTVTGYSGAVRQLWLDLVQGRVLGLTYAAFRRQLSAYNPSLATTGGRLVAEERYLLPRTVGVERCVVTATTTPRGRFRFPDLPVGSYTIEVNAAGMQPFATSLVLNEAVEVALALAPLLTDEPVTQARGAGGGALMGTIGREFVVNGRIFRFVGVNLRGLVYYGAGLTTMLKYTEAKHREECLQRASDMGAKVVRVFLPCVNASAQQTIAHLRTTLDAAGSRGLYLIPALVDFYKSTDFRIPGDDHFYAQLDPKYNLELLKGDFYCGGYRERYLPFVRAVVEAFNHDPRIFAWEIGNELKYEPAHADPERAAFISFMHTVAREIKRIDPNHLVTTGMISTSHASMNEGDLWRRLYGGPEFDFITIHCYNEEYAGKQDYDYARVLNKPFIIEEAGFGGKCPGNRVEQIGRDMARWFGFGASGYMQWGFMPVNGDIGDGDDDSGMDRKWHGGDFDGLWNLYRQRAEQLAAECAALPRPAQPPPPLPADFQPGQTVYAQTVVNVRQSPGYRQKPPDDVLGQLAVGAAATVTAAPVTQDGLTWWPLQATLTDGRNVEGWAAEAIPDTRLLGDLPPS